MAGEIDGSINEYMDEKPCVGERNMNETYFMVLRISGSSRTDKLTKK